MSYCRWSSMNFKCDLYCYEHCDGTWTTHIASNKVVTPIFPDAPWVLLKGGLIGRYLFVWWHRLHMWTVGIGKRAAIGLKFDGETFKDDSLEGFRDTLLLLRREGYRFPDYVLEIVDEEIAALAAAAMAN